MDDEVIRQRTELCLNRGVRVLQIWQRGTEAEHVEWLLKRAALPIDARVLDIACGVGEVAQQAKHFMPDLKFSLQNHSASQLSLCPYRLPKYLGDMHYLKNVPSNHFDVAMLCYALGYVVDLDMFFYHVHRVLKPNGFLFIYDVLPTDQLWAWEVLEYRTHRPKDVLAEASEYFNGIYFQQLDQADFNTDGFSRVVGEELTKKVMKLTRPIIYKFTKGESL